MTYEDLLEKAYEKLPKMKEQEERFEIPKVEAVIEGNRTIFRNFIPVAQALRREPRHLLKYLTKELAAPGNIDGQRAIFQSKLFTKIIDPRIKTNCICCPPDPHPKEYYCAWEFILEE